MLPIKGFAMDYVNPHNGRRNYNVSSIVGTQTVHGSDKKVSDVVISRLSSLPQHSPLRHVSGASFSYNPYARAIDTSARRYLKPVDD
jgi:hypothetical protein